nr:VAN3-binding protein-like [Tanacetum cinerariifolium]
MEFLSRSWSVSALQVSKALAPSQSGGLTEEGDKVCGGEMEQVASAGCGNLFAFASSETSQLIMERILAQS